MSARSGGQDPASFSVVEAATDSFGILLIEEGILDFLNVLMD